MGVPPPVRVSLPLWCWIPAIASKPAPRKALRLVLVCPAMLHSGTSALIAGPKRTETSLKPLQQGRHCIPI